MIITHDDVARKKSAQSLLSLTMFGIWSPENFLIELELSEVQLCSRKWGRMTMMMRLSKYLIIIREIGRGIKGPVVEPLEEGLPSTSPHIALMFTEIDLKKKEALFFLVHDWTHVLILWCEKVFLNQRKVNRANLIFFLILNNLLNLNLSN